MLVAEVAESGGNAVEERLRADEAMVGKHVGAVGEMLARAEADLEMQRPVVAEEAPRGDLALTRQFEFRQQPFDQLLLISCVTCVR